MCFDQTNQAIDTLRLPGKTVLLEDSATDSLEDLLWFRTGELAQLTASLRVP